MFRTTSKGEISNMNCTSSRQGSLNSSLTNCDGREDETPSLPAPSKTLRVLYSTARGANEST